MFFKIILGQEWVFNRFKTTLMKGLKGIVKYPSHAGTVNAFMKTKFEQTVLLYSSLIKPRSHFKA